ncbi:MAG: CopD family protein [Chromatiales bacterium]
MTIALILHVLAAVVWIGGMFFAYVCLRPVAASLLDAPQRLNLWIGVFRRFFLLVWLAVLILPASGFYLATRMFGGLGRAPLYVHVMLGVGTLMILLFLHVYFAPYRRLRRFVAAQDYQQGARQLAQIRRLVGINILLGIVVAAVASGGRILGA